MLKLTLLHTNDIHGRVSQLSRIASLVRQIRQDVESAGNACLYMDAGDSEDTVMLESSLTKGSAMEAILRAAGCEYAALGNAIPIRYGHHTIKDLALHFGRPLLCANFHDEHGNEVAGLEPMAFETYDSLKIAIIGLTDPLDVYQNFFNLQVSQPANVLPGLLREAKEQGAKTIIILSHLGSGKDQQLAKDAPDIDLIIGAHDHKELYPPLLVNGTIIVQAGEYGKNLGRLDLTIDPDSGKILHYRGELIPITEDLPLDMATQMELEAQQKRVQAMMGREIGHLTTDIVLSDERECAAGNLLADALLDRVRGAQLALVLSGHWETGLGAGPLTQGALFSAIRSTANPGKVALTGAQLIRYLRDSLKPENSSRKLRPLRGRAVGRPHVAGACVRYSQDLETIVFEIDGRAVEPDQKYVVASTDMELSNYVGYLVLPDDQIEYEVPTIMPEVLEDYISKRSPLEAPESGRVTLQEK